MHVFKISVGQKVVGQTSWLVHWEQGSAANARQTVPKAQKKVSRESVNPYRLALRKILFKRPTLSVLM